MLCAKASKSSIILKEERKNQKLSDCRKYFWHCMAQGILSSLLELASRQGHVLGADKPCSYNTPESDHVIFCYLFSMGMQTED